MKILVALGEGGHTKETLTLVGMLGDDLQFGYLIVQDDEVSERKIRRPGPVYYVLRPRDKQHRLLRDIAKTLQSAMDSWRALARFRPDAVLSSGPSVAVPVCVLARLSRCKVIFVETGSRITALSLTGRIMYHVAHLFFVQWPELQERYPRAIYAGRLF
jgi:beta-1,4-N-acetylglucosaminyltransferase